MSDRVYDRWVGAALTEETLHTEVLSNEQLRIEIIPALGGKLSSLRAMRNDSELLQEPLAPYSPRTSRTLFQDADASGFDECLPSVSACTVASAAGRISIPDHGEFWRIPHRVRRTREEVTVEATGSVLPLRFERRFRMDKNRLRIDYTLTNIARHRVDYVWSAHPLFAVEEGDRIDLPPSAQSILVEGSAAHRLGPPGSIHPWPLADTRSGVVDLSIVGKASDGIADKVYASAPREGWCALERTRLNLRIQIRFQPEVIPFLGLWLCYGGWPAGRTTTQYCVALEPCTAPGDSLSAAINDGFAKSLEPGAQDKWALDIIVDAAS
jgi:galactose mutarotase-like enzyme